MKACFFFKIKEQKLNLFSFISYSKLLNIQKKKQGHTIFESFLIQKKIN